LISRIALLTLAVLFVLPLSAQIQPTLILRMSEIQPEDFPTTKADYEFARRVKELSKGRIAVEVYAGGVLGDEVSVIEQVQFGGIDLARVSIAAVQLFAPRMAALFMPYLYRDDNHMWKVLTGPIGRELLADLEAGRLVGLGWFEAGARSFYTVGAPLKRTADLTGLHIRVQESIPMMSLVEAFGVTPIPMAFANVYGALRTGEIDGAENNLATYYASGHYKVAPYYTLDEHARLPEVIIASAVALAEMAPADRELLRQAAQDVAGFQREIWASYEEEISRSLQAAGVLLLRPDNLGLWQKLARSVWSGQPAEVQKLLQRIQETR